MGLGVRRWDVWVQCFDHVGYVLVSQRYVYLLIPCDMVVSGQLWSLATCSVQVRLRIQLNSILFAKTLVRKDVASSAAPTSESEDSNGKAKVVPTQETSGSQPDIAKKDGDEGEFSSKAQIMTLMTTDVDRVSEFAWHMYTLVGLSRLSPVLLSATGY